METQGSWYSDGFRPCVAEFLGVALFVFIGCLAVQDSLVGPPGSLPPSAVAVALAHGLTIALLVAAVGQIRPCIAEVLGETMFVFVTCLATQDPTSSPGGHVVPPAVCAALANGFFITVVIVMLGDISGAHLNPAVTLGIALSGGIKPLLAVAYVISQLTGSIVGAGLVRAVLPDDTYAGIGAGAHTLGNMVEPFPAIVCEMMLTLVLVLTVLMCAVDRADNVLAPLAIGFAVAVDILAGIYVTGASMNPARSFGPAVMVSGVKNVWTHHYVYWVGPALGSLLAVAFYRFCLANPQKRLIMKGTSETEYQQFK